MKCQKKVKDDSNKRVYLCGRVLELNVECVWFVSAFATLGCSSGSCSESSLPGSPRIRLFVLQQAACGIGYIYTIRDGERVSERRTGWEEMEGRGQQIGNKTKQKKLFCIFCPIFRL